MATCPTHRARRMWWGSRERTRRTVSKYPTFKEWFDPRDEIGLSEVDLAEAMRNSGPYQWWEFGKALHEWLEPLHKGLERLAEWLVGGAE